MSNLFFQRATIVHWINKLFIGSSPEHCAFSKNSLSPHNLQYHWAYLPWPLSTADMSGGQAINTTITPATTCGWLYAANFCRSPARRDPWAAEPALLEAASLPNKPVYTGFPLQNKILALLGDILEQPKCCSSWGRLTGRCLRNQQQ